MKDRKDVEGAGETRDWIAAKDARIAELEAKVARVEALADGYAKSGRLDVANYITVALTGSGPWQEAGDE